MSMNSATDNRIIAMLGDRGDPEAGVRMLVELYGERIYWHVRRLVLFHEEAEELTQDTFVRACFRIGSYRGEGPFSAWLYRIATNEALQWIRRKRAGRKNLIGVECLSDLPAEEVELGDAAADLFAEAVLRLPPRQRSVFTLRYYDGMSYRQIAQVMETTESNARTTYHYATDKIRDFIKEHGYE